MQRVFMVIRPEKFIDVESLIDRSGLPDELRRNRRFKKFLRFYIGNYSKALRVVDIIPTDVYK